MISKNKKILKWMGIALLAYLSLVVLVFIGQMIHGAVRDADADLVDQSLDPALTQIVQYVREIVVANRTPVYQRDAHAKPHGCVRAVFSVPEVERRYRHRLICIVLNLLLLQVL